MRPSKLCSATKIEVSLKRRANAQSVGGTITLHPVVLAIAVLLLTAPTFAQTPRPVQQRPAIERATPFLGPVPDLRVTRVVFNNVDCNDSLCLRVEVDIRNSGEATRGPVDVRLSYRAKSGAPWKQLETFHFAAQAHNHDTGAAKRFAFQESGDYCFLAEIDPENKVQPAAPTKSRASECHHYDAGIPDPTPASLTIRNCTNGCSGFMRIRNAGDGKLAGSIKWVLECSVDGKVFRKDRDRQGQFTLGPGEVSGDQYWVYDAANAQTFRCRVTIYPTMRERTTINNSLTSDLWRKP